MKVLITTSGTGSRLGELTKYTNKALVRVGKKPAISYIIDSYPADTEFVVTVGYKGDQVKDFLTLTYPNLNIAFVEVDMYGGEGSSLGYSMLCAKDKLESPFIYHACDTIVENFTYPTTEENWVAGIHIPDSKQYTSFTINKEGYIEKFNPKSATDYGLIHIGLIQVFDYQSYWQALEELYRTNPNDEALNDTQVLDCLVKQGKSIRAIPVNTWFDIGNPEALAHAREKISDRFDNLDKVDEALYFFDGFAIKFFADPEKVRNRVKRGHLLGSLVPPTLAVRDNFYKYQYVEGERYSDVADPEDFKRLLSWLRENLWQRAEGIDPDNFKDVCRDFYEVKTRDRIAKFLASENLTEEEMIINGEFIPPIGTLLGRIDFDWLSCGTQTKFHGDCILENILKIKDGYCLLDWRQDFGGLLEDGDMYYDLSKLAHNLVVNHDIVSQNLFTINKDGKQVTCAIERKPNLVECEQALEEFLIDNNLDVKKVKILRSLIWLNMSPLHHRPFNLFLYYFGVYTLWQVLNEH